MLISYNWLRELTGTTSTPRELRDRLTMVGLAIDAVEELEGDSVLDVEVPSNRRIAFHTSESLAKWP